MKGCEIRPILDPEHPCCSSAEHSAGGEYSYGLFAAQDFLGNTCSAPLDTVWTCSFLPTVCLLAVVAPAPTSYSTVALALKPPIRRCCLLLLLLRLGSRAVRRRGPCVQGARLAWRLPAARSATCCLSSCRNSPTRV